VLRYSHVVAPGGNDIRRHSRQQASLAPPCSILRSFRSIFTLLKKLLVSLLGLFGAPAVIRPPAIIRRTHNDSAPGLYPITPFVTPLGHCYLYYLVCSNYLDGMTIPWKFVYCLVDILLTAYLTSHYMNIIVWTCQAVVQRERVAFCHYL